MYRKDFGKEERNYYKYKTIKNAAEVRGYAVRG